MTYQHSGKYIVIGGTPQGLEVVRLLGRAGVEPYVFCRNKHQVAYHSKYGTKMLYETAEQLRIQIEQIADSETNKPICFICSGEALALILRQYPDLYTTCRVFAGPFDFVEQMAHKDLMYTRAIEKGLHIAPFVTLDKCNPEELNFPVIVKRNYEIELFFKVAYIDNIGQFRDLISKIPQQAYPDIIIQRRIDIHENSLREISCQGYFVDGKMIGCLAAFQVRKSDTGLTAYIEEIEDTGLYQKVKSIAADFINGSTYNGFAEFEFMLNTQSGELHFMEVNTRTCGEQSSMHLKYENIADAFLYPGQDIALRERPGRVRWMNIARDVKIRLQKKDFKNLSQIFHAGFDVFDTRDIMPFIRQFF